jgi:hypothetical protein
MIRDRRWKYVHRYPMAPRLYDLAADQADTRNLINDSAKEDKLVELRGRSGRVVCALLDRGAMECSRRTRKGQTTLPPGRQRREELLIDWIYRKRKPNIRPRRSGGRAGDVARGDRVTRPSPGPCAIAARF